MRDIKVTVIESLVMENLVKEYAAPGLGICTKHQVGEVHISPRGQSPPGFCEEAWKSISHYAFAMAHGAQGFWPQWIAQRNVAIVCCNDALRPVFFKLEPVEE